jgi:hypothetical protein
MEQRVEENSACLNLVTQTNTMKPKLNFITKARVQNGGILFCNYHCC